MTKVTKDLTNLDMLNNDILYNAQGKGAPICSGTPLVCPSLRFITIVGTASVPRPLRYLLRVGTTVVAVRVRTMVGHLRRSKL